MPALTSRARSTKVAIWLEGHTYRAPRNFCMLRRARRYQGRARELIKMTKAALDAHRKYIVENLEDMPAIRNWKWTPD